jgi:hypothetical protein
VSHAAASYGNTFPLVREEPFWRRRLDRVTLITAVAIVVLNLVDAFSTLRHVDWGAEEVNPLMRMLLGGGPMMFLVGKHILAAGGVIGIAAHCRHAAARRMLGYVLLPVYLAIAAYQLSLFAFL